MRPTVRAMLVITVPALALGALAGYVLRVVAPPSPGVLPSKPDRPTDGPAQAAEPGAVDVRPGARREPSRRAQPPRVERSNARNRANGEGPLPAPLDPAVTDRLSDASERVRTECAVELLRMGTPRLDAISVLAPRTEEGRALVDRVVNALTDLRANENTEDYWHMPDESKAELRLRLFSRVVPLESLAAERRRYWQKCVDADRGRLASGVIAEGEALWHKVELARARFELREIAEDSWKRTRDASIAAIRTWAAELAADRRADPAKAAAAAEAVERLSK